jgi:hypothetical protein
MTVGEVGAREWMQHACGFKKLWLLRESRSHGAASTRESAAGIWIDMLRTV